MQIFSYKKAIQDVVESAIFARGVRDFLEGKVLSHEDLILDYWRLYKVLGKYEYDIKFPLIHFALTKSKFDLAGEALLQSAICTCENFIQSGYCRHLVAVCSSLDDEFNLDWKQKSDINSTHSKSILDTIFEVENSKLFREFENKMDVYILQGKIKDNGWVEKYALNVAQNQSEFEIYLQSYTKKIQNYLENWDWEKRLVGLIPRFLMFGKKLWWDFFSTYFSQINLELSYELYAQIWELHTLKFSGEYQKDWLEFIKNLDDTGKQAVLDILQQKFKLNRQIWLDFAIFSGYQTWIKANLDYLDPLTLLKLASQNTDISDEIEIHLAKQIKVWSDFVTGGDQNEYQEIIQVFHKWEETIGRTENFERTLEYVKAGNPKKRKLLKSLK